MNLGPDVFHAITVWQPWASLIAIGAKPFEFRRYAAPRHYLGARIAIHAGMRPVVKSEITALLYQLSTPSWPLSGLVRGPEVIELLEKVASNPKGMTHGAVLCTATLGKPIRNEALAAELGTTELLNDSDRAEHSNWGWPLTDIYQLEPPVNAKGSQGWWTVKLEGAR